MKAILPYLALLAASAAWGGLFHAGKLVVSVIDPFWFTALRYTSAALLSAPFLLAAPASAVLPSSDWLRLMGLGLLGYGFFAILVFVGLQHSIPAHGAVIMATMPMTMLVVNALSNRRLPPLASLFAISCATIGVCLVAGIFTRTSATQPSTWKGDMTALVGTLGWIAYTHGAARFYGLSPLRYTGWTTLLAAPGLLAIAIIVTLSGHAAWPTAGQLVKTAPAMLYTVIVATIGAAWAYNFGIRRLGPAQGIVFVNFIPITATMISLITGRQPSSEELIGGALVILALLLHARSVAMQTADGPT